MPWVLAAVFAIAWWGSRRKYERWVDELLDENTALMGQVRQRGGQRGR